MSPTAAPDRTAIETRQLEALRTLVRALLDGNPYYGPKLAAAGITGNIASLDTFVERMPVTTKQHMVDDQRLNPPFGTNLTYPLTEYTRFSQTSATTGTPMRWLDTNDSWSWMLDNWTTVFTAAGVSANDTVFFAFSFGPFLGFWTAFEAATHMGCLSIPGGGMSSAARIRTMLDAGAQVLCCTPTYAIHLGETAAKEGVDLSRSRVRTIIVAGEPGGSVPATRSHIERLWPNARVFDHHGMTEVGPVTYECPRCPGRLHVIETSYIAEVVDPESLEPVEPGDTGELLLTTLGRIASPLLRYRTGDLVRQSSTVPCQCGRYDMALEGGILARADDMLTIRGVNVFPSAVDQVVRSEPAVVEYRVHVHTDGAMNELSVEVEPADDVNDAAALCERLAHALRDAFNLRIPVRAAAPGSLPRFEMKAKRWAR